MDAQNPYAAPSETAAPADTRDSVDLYRATLPTPAVHTTGIVALISGIATVAIDARIVSDLVAMTVPSLVILGALGVAGVGYFAVAWGVREGRAWSLAVGLVACVLGLLASALVLLSGVLAGLLGGALALFTAVMLLTTARAVRSMSQARAALAKLERAA